jgi:hypothetical protein
MSGPLRPSLSELKVNPGACLKSARKPSYSADPPGTGRRELLSMDEAPCASVGPLLGCGSHLVASAPGIDLTEPVDADSDAAFGAVFLDTTAILWLLAGEPPRLAIVEAIEAARRDDNVLGSPLRHWKSP